VLRKLFNAMVGPVVDYASSVWTHTRTASAERVLKRVQRVGGQAVVGCFRTVGTVMAEAEANFPTIGERHARKALRMWVDLHSMSGTYPLALVAMHRTYKRFTSPIQKIAQSAQGAPLDEMEATQSYISAPWDARLDIANGVDDGEQAAGCAQGIQGIRVATNASARNRLIGSGGAIDGIDWIRNNSERCEYDKTVGTNAQSDAYTAAMASIKVGLGLVVSAVYDNSLSARVRGQVMHVFTNNLTVLVTLHNAARRSGQWIIIGVLKHMRRLEELHNRVVFA
jgi:hypothetical protein